MRRRWQRYAICALIAVVSAAAARLLSETRFFKQLNFKAFDLQFVLRGKRPVSQIVLIVIDQKAVDAAQAVKTPNGKEIAFKDELLAFWHPFYAQAIQAAADAGAKVIGLDLAFGVPVERWEPGFDALLAGAVASAPVPVVVGYVPALNTNQIADPIPVNMIAGGLGLAGFANLTVDDDEFVRTQELIEAPPGTARSLAMRVTEKYLGADLDASRHTVTLAGKPVPGRTIYINYAGPPNTFPSISIADVIAAAASDKNDPRRARLKSMLDGKIVLIGKDWIDDRYASPFYTLHSGSQFLTAGVEIHANTIHTLLDRAYLLDVPGIARIAALVAATLVTGFIALATSAGAATGWVILEILMILAGTQLLFRAGRILPASEIVVAVTLCLIGVIIYRFATAEERGNLFRRAISVFVGKELAVALEDNATIGLSGVKETVTIMFTDIRGFTAFTEKMSDEQGPEVVVKILNEYLAVMTSFIIAHKGHVNKFIGDGILAVFADTDEGAVRDDHARRAVQCAFEMVSAPNRFETGAGIHTGTAIIGNVGSADKMEYTVLGDSVNLASRLESLNKEFHTKLLMSGETQSLVGTAIATTYLAAAPVKGKTAPIPLYTVTELTLAPAHV
jgi:class 3 adenylate cyclase